MNNLNLKDLPKVPKEMVITLTDDLLKLIDTHAGSLGPGVFYKVSLSYLIGSLYDQCKDSNIATDLLTTATKAGIAISKETKARRE